MPLLKRLNISGLRNLNHVSIDLSPSLNLFFGKNGSGKTSILESVYFLGRGRSFRTHKSKTLINHALSELTLFSELMSISGPTTVGITKNKNSSSQIRVSGDNVTSSSLLAKHLPLLILSSDSFQLIEGSPVKRRHFLDWMVFHVKPEFLSLWSRFQRVIKQRNSLLKHGKITRDELRPWDKEYIELARFIDASRREVFDDFLLCAKPLVARFTENIINPDFHYHAGWNDEKSLEEQLDHSFDRDLKSGFTHLGPHRADIRIRVSGMPAIDVLSRGQEKSLISALHIAQAQLYNENLSQNCVFLVDDMLSELDQHNAALLSESLLKLNTQVFVTGVSKEDLIHVWSCANESSSNEEFSANKRKETRVFHVKQGEVIPD